MSNGQMSFKGERNAAERNRREREGEGGREEESGIKMTQKGNMFKGQQKKKSIPPNRHGKAPQTRKGKRVVKASKFSKESDAEREITKFINQCNEIKATSLASKEGGEFNILKHESGSASSSKK